MSLVRQGSRRILVEAGAFRWVVRPRPTYCQGAFLSSLTFAVDLECHGQSTLVVSVEAPRPDNWLGKPGFVVTPSLVARAIELALQRGWDPRSRGSAFELQLSASAHQQTARSAEPRSSP